MQKLPTPIKKGEDLAKLFAEKYGNLSSSKSVIAFYSSYLDCITDEHQYMVIPLCDRMVHRAHSVFDTVLIRGRRFHLLAEHLKRFQKSASAAKIDFPFGLDVVEEKFRDLAKFSYEKIRNDDEYLNIRYFLSNGYSPFDIFPVQGTGKSVLYAICQKWANPKGSKPYEEGTREYIIRNVPSKPPFLAQMKSTNYLLNALVAGEARTKGGYQGVMVDNEGNLLECSCANIAFVTNDGYFLEMEGEGILSGTTLDLSKQFIQNELVKVGLVKGLKTGKVKFEDVIKGKTSEMIILGGDKILGCTHLDDEPIGEGKKGPVTTKLQEAYEKATFEGEKI